MYLCFVQVANSFPFFQKANFQSLQNFFVCKLNLWLKFCSVACFLKFFCDFLCFQHRCFHLSFFSDTLKSLIKWCTYECVFFQLTQYPKSSFLNSDRVIWHNMFLKWGVEWKYWGRYCIFHFKFCQCGSSFWFWGVGKWK